MTDSKANTNIFYRTDESAPDDTETVQLQDNDKTINVSESLFSDSTPYSELFGKSNDFDNGFEEFDSKLVQNLKTNFVNEPLSKINQNNISSPISNNYYSIKYNVPLSHGIIDTHQIKNKLLDMQRDMIDTEYLPRNSSGNPLKKNSPNSSSKNSHTYSTSSYSETSIQKSDNNSHVSSTNSNNSVLTGGKPKEVILSSTQNTSSMFPISVSTTDTFIQLPINYSESVPLDSHKSSSKTPSYTLVLDNSYEKGKEKKKKRKKKRERKSTPRPKKGTRVTDKDRLDRMYMY